MLIRRKILPRTTSDLLSIIFLLIIVPIIYWFELWIVLPEVFSVESLEYLFHFVLGNFIMINIVGNFTYTVLCDTSVRQIVSQMDKVNVADGWRFCVICERISPPRSWHCNTCRTCILKRDHHCIFTGCCIGHTNYRYFILFLFYLFIATLYCFFYNNYFLWKRIKFEFPMTLLKMIFPLAIFVFGFDGSMNQLYLLLYDISLVGMLFTGALFFYHIHLVLIGCTPNEKNKSSYLYSLGYKQNIIEVFGDKWYLAWILPYISSQLPQDGMYWQRSSHWNMNHAKYK